MCDIHGAIVMWCELSVCILCAVASCLCTDVSCLCASVYCTRTHELESENQLMCSCECLYHKTCVSQALGKAVGIHCRHWEEQEKAAPYTRLDIPHTHLFISLYTPRHTHTRLDIPHTRLDIPHTRLFISYTRLDIPIPAYSYPYTRLDIPHTRL